MRSIELFSGTGGLAKGLETAGFEHEAFVEYNKHACSSLRENFNPELIFEGDISNYSFSKFKEIDLVAGGPPCQPFSLGGKHKAFNDTRDMFPHAIRAIEELKPKAFLFENVKGLLRPSFSNYFEYIIARLSLPDEALHGDADWRTHLQKLRKINPLKYTGMKYNVSYKLINAADYGVPQLRERVIIVGIRSDLDIDWSFPKPTHSGDRLIWEQMITGDYWKKHKINDPNKYISDFMRKKELALKRFGLIPPEGLPWQTVRSALMNVPDPKSRHFIDDHLYKAGAKSYPGHTGSDYESPAKTIKAGGHGVPGGENMLKLSNGSVRYLTVYEAKILQTFPQAFKINGPWGEAMRQIGNAVPVQLAKIFGEHLYNLLLQNQSYSVDYAKSHERMFA